MLFGRRAIFPGPCLSIRTTAADFGRIVGGLAVLVGLGFSVADLVLPRVVTIAGFVAGLVWLPLVLVAVLSSVGLLLDAILAGGLAVGDWLTFSGIILGIVFGVLGYRRGPKTITQETSPDSHLKSPP
jgi:hypothetical protein